jgi:hypothetical protein
MDFEPNHKEAERLYKQADDADWDRRFDAADRLRQMADKLMEQPDEPYIPF